LLDPFAKFTFPVRVIALGLNMENAKEMEFANVKKVGKEMDVKDHYI